MRAGPPPTRRFRLAVRFPTNRPGRSEPLVTAGRTKGGGRGSIFHLSARDGFGLAPDHWGEDSPESDPVPVTDGAYQILEVEFGAGGWADAADGKIRVRLNGRSIMSESTDFYPVDPGTVIIGRNPIGFSTSDPDFTGRNLPD